MVRTFFTFIHFMQKLTVLYKNKRLEWGYGIFQGYGKFARVRNFLGYGLYQNVSGNTVEQ